MWHSTSLRLQGPSRRVARAGVVAVCSLILACSAAMVRAQPVAVVADKAGDVWMDTAGLPLPVALLDYLSVGTRLKLGSASRLVILYLQTGHQYTAEGPGWIEVTPAQLLALAGAVPLLQVPPAGKEIRLRPGRVALGGIVMRSMKPVDAAASASVQPTSISDPLPAPRPAGASVAYAEIELRRPPADVSYAARVAFALWLDDVGATVEAQQAWRALSVERPGDAALARRAQ